MSPITLEEAQSRLVELIERLKPGEEVLITRGSQPVARLVSEATSELKRQRQLGTLQGTVSYIAPDFDASLDDSREYME